MTGAELIAKFATKDTNQMSTYLAYKKNSLDLFSMPLDTVSDLTAITKAYRYVGMKMKVLNTDTDNVMTEYWWNGKEWKLVEQGKDYTEEINEILETMSSGDTMLQYQIDEINDKLDNLHVASSTTINTTSASTTVYNYIDKTTGEEKETTDEQEAKDNANESGYTTTTTEVKTEVVTNTYITDIDVKGTDVEYEPPIGDEVESIETGGTDGE